MLITLVKDRRRSNWRVIDKRERVEFSARPGPWLLVVPQGAPPESQMAQWVHALFGEYKVMPFSN